MIKIGDKVDISNGYAFKSSKYVEQGIRVVRITNVQKGEIQDDNPKFYSSDTKEELKSYLINEGDILMSLTGNVGRVGVFPKEYCPAYLNQRVARIRVKSQDLFQKYLFYMLNSEFFERDAIFNSSGIAQLNLSTKWVSEYKIPLPPLDQQKEIAAILDAADAYRQKTKALIEKYDDLSQSLFLDMFGDPVTNPKGWDEVIFTDVLILKRGFDLPVQDRTKGEYPIMASNGILDWHNDFKVQGPGVVTGRSGTLGHVHLVESDYWPLNTALYSQNLNGNNPTFLLFLLRNFRVERFSRGAGVPTLNRNLVHAESIINVPIELQSQFAESVKAIEAQKAQAQASLAQAEDLFNSLLQKAFKGELV